MRWFLLLAALPIPLASQSTLYTCMTVTKEYVVGAKLPLSGLFLRGPSGWQHAGYNHPFVFGLDYDPADPSTVYLAAGNALIRAQDHGQRWTFLTGGDVTELRDVSVDRNTPRTIYFAHSHGIRVTHDAGATWQELSGGLHRKFTEAIRVDRTHSIVLLAGGEEGIFRSADAGQTWRLAGAAGAQITRIEQSPHDPCLWLATTYLAGLFISTDCGVTFENAPSRVGVDRNLYDVAFDSSSPQRIAVAGWGPGIAVSEDLGKTWALRNNGLPAPHARSVIFDPDHPGRIYASIHEEALYVSNDLGHTWQKDGLEGSDVMRMKFVPQAGVR